MTVDPHLPFKFAGARAVVPFTGRYGHRPPTPDPNALDSDEELDFGSKKQVALLKSRAPEF